MYNIHYYSLLMEKSNANAYIYSMQKKNNHTLKKTKHSFKDYIKNMSFPLKYLKIFLDILSSIVLRIYLCIGKLIAFHTY